MQESPFSELEECFGNVDDPRVEGRCEHKLIDIIIIAICGVICGANSWSEIETFGRAKEGWLRQYLDLSGGIPSHDTFGRVFSLVDAQSFQASFRRWVEQVFQVTKGQVVAIDGKSARRSQDSSIGRDAIHLVNAWASANKLALGQYTVDSKSNEITAIPELLRVLNVADCVVTIDAMGCQKAIAQTIVEQNADYVLAVKGNQGQLYQDVADWFAHAQQVAFQGLSSSFAETTSKVSGRVEKRRCWAIDDPLAFDYIRHYEGWTGLQTIIMVQRERCVADVTQPEIAYYISSLPADAKHLLTCIRDHWSIENTLHWTLDVVFREDESRVRLGDGPQNFALLRTLALNILKHDRSKASLNQKRFRAALDDHYLFQLLAQF
jgi:predicted transposase YbfD/YdcC